MIKICKIAALVCFSLLYAATPAELYLVVGSNKTEGQLHSPYLRSYHHNPAADFTHEHTFDGMATTLDLHPDDTVPGRHISQTDVCSFIPEAPIVAVFMELFPSHGVRTVLDLQRMAAAQDPAIKLQNIRGLSARSINYASDVRNFLLKRMIEEMETPPTIDAILMPHAIENLVKHMKPGANLYIEHIPLLALKADNCFSLNVSPRFLVELNLALTEPFSTSLCRQAVDLVQAAMEISTGEIRLTREEYFAKLTQEVDACVAPEAFHQSLSLLVLLELERLEQSQPESPINKFLESQGFTNITHERVTNPFNSRSYSWMISAVNA